MFKHVLACALLALSSAPALASSASNFTLVNGTGGELSALSIRRVGARNWKPLGNAPSPGARTAVTFSDPECAFDIQATVPGSGPITWTSVNLCDVKSVTLQRDGTAGPWVDYDQ